MARIITFFRYFWITSRSFTVREVFCVFWWILQLCFQVSENSPKNLKRRSFSNISWNCNLSFTNMVRNLVEKKVLSFPWLIAIGYLVMRIDYASFRFTHRYLDFDLNFVRLTQKACLDSQLFFWFVFSRRKPKTNIFWW